MIFFFFPFQEGAIIFIIAWSNNTFLASTRPIIQISCSVLIHFFWVPIFRSWAFRTIFCLVDTPRWDLSRGRRDELPSPGAQSLCLESPSDADCDVPQDCHQLPTRGTYLHHSVIPLPHPGGGHIHFTVRVGLWLSNVPELRNLSASKAQ